MADLVAILSISFAGVVSIISAIQNSKCDVINCGCIKLHRKLDDKPPSTSGT